MSSKSSTFAAEIEKAMRKYCFLFLILLMCAPMRAQEASDFEIQEVTIVQRKKGKVKSRTADLL